MPKRTDISSILIVGAGPIIIGQACEFDYSGTQACKALRELGYRVILVNSNPATIMTDPEMADVTYVEPVEAQVVEQIIAAERPDALLSTMGGQSALNVAMALADNGVLERHGVQLIGANRQAIATAEDRALFRAAMDRIGLESPRSGIATSMLEARHALREVGLPAIIRPAFTLGGTGGGIANTTEEFETIVRAGLDASPVGQVLVDESLIGWKEFELEVVRDRADNAIIVCSIENIDPMGVHTGDSITVAPALTLTDREYQRMRNAAIACIREIGVETGGSNVQFAVDPVSGRMVVIELNPRVSRSSALASKATGFPIAKVAAKLAVGFTLDELENEVTKATPASFEPSIDYVVTKIPRFDFEKFPGAAPELGTEMKSVGEAMAIGRNFAASLQKAFASLETGLDGLDDLPLKSADPEARREEVRRLLDRRTPDRFRAAAQGLREGLEMHEVRERTRFDPWFLDRLQEIVDLEKEVQFRGLPNDAAGLRRLKGHGFSDRRLARLAGVEPEAVRSGRLQVGVVPVYKRIDTCAAEFEAETPFMYSSYEADAGGGAEDEARPSARRKVVILGGGPNRIGQGIEFDYCCCHACFELSDAGYETVMVNCNPETVSTDPDSSDRLYFEPLTEESVRDILEVEGRSGEVAGVIAQFGGQTPLRLAEALERSGARILGTPFAAIDLAEDRERFKERLATLGIRQPKNATATCRAEAVAAAREIGYPAVIRPSYVLGGRAMRIARDEAELVAFADAAFGASGANPVLVDGFVEGAIELDVDAVSDGEDVWIAGILEHIEEAGVHSGDSACALPPHTVPAEVLAKLRDQTAALARSLGVVGLMNVQYALHKDELFVLEVNPRASRTAPFIAKAIGVPIVRIAARVALGEKLSDFHLTEPILPHTAVKEAVFPFARFRGVDTLLGPEMRSTGEVMGIDLDFARAYLKAQRGAGNRLPNGGTVFISVRDADKPTIAAAARQLAEMDFRLLATRGTAGFLARRGVPAETVNKVHEGAPHIVDRVSENAISLVFNTTEGEQAIRDSFTLREAVVRLRIPYCTTLPGAVATVQAIAIARQGPLAVRSLQSYATAAHQARPDGAPSHD